MSARAWRCQCGKAFRTWAELCRHDGSGSCAVLAREAAADRERGRAAAAARARGDGASGGPVDRGRGVRVAHTLPADWTGDLDRPSLDLPGLVPLTVPGRAS